MSGARIAVVVVCHNSARSIGATLSAVRAQLLRGDELVVVDNASSDATVAAAAAAAPDATVLPLGENVGFAAGCHAGTAASSAPLLLFLNPDAVPAPGCIEALRAIAEEQPRWGAWQALVTMPDGTTVNTAGNSVHFVGIGWAGRCGDPVAAVEPEPREVGFASGAALVVRREAWDAVGGFDARYFMYGEDLDLSLRLRLAGWAVGTVPAARVAHDYDFVKGDYKWFYLERNRWWTILAAYPLALLVLLAPALAAFELAVVVAAWRGGWLTAKLRAQRSVVRDLRGALTRRRAVQAGRAVSLRAFAAPFEATAASPYLPAVVKRGLPAALQSIYWRVVLALVP
jgi:GT2 family glycosyltransferase